MRNTLKKLNKDSEYIFLIYCLMILLITSVNVQSQETVSDNVFLDEVAEKTYNYLSSDWATSNHLPWSWRSEILDGGDFTNTTEIALLLLSHLGSYELNRSWSPDWMTVESEIHAILDQLITWQTGNQHNAYENSVFYQWYWINWNPPVVGGGDSDRLVPSIDNAFLAASLITLRSYGEIHHHPEIAEKSDLILSQMDFRLWYDEKTHLFNWGANDDPLGGVWADFYSNENRIINFVARSLGQLSQEEYQNSLDSLIQNSVSYNRDTVFTSDDVIVQNVAWDGSYFTYLAPSLFIREMNTSYFDDTVIPATWSQITYASDQGYTVWGLSDCYDIGSGGYIGQGAPPTALSGTSEIHRGVITPHASGMALITPYRDLAINNLQRIQQISPNAFHPEYAYYDSLMADPNSSQYGEYSYRFSAIAQGWLFLSIVNAETNFIWDYFYHDRGVQIAHSGMFEG